MKACGLCMKRPFRVTYILGGLKVRATAPASARLATFADPLTSPTAIETLSTFQTVALFHYINPLGFRLFRFICRSHAATYGVFNKSETKNFFGRLRQKVALLRH